MKVKDITGMRFGRWTVLRRNPDSNVKTRNAVWVCRCDCGTIADVVGSVLRKGISTSCGCYRYELLKAKRLSEEQRKAISERNSCNYNGLNGYGHTKKHKNGYIITYCPKHPHATKDGYIMLHTVLMERQLGRYLNDDEVVHHINHIRDDNRAENLMLMKKFDHMSMHMKERHAKRRNALLTACL